MKRKFVKKDHEINYQHVTAVVVTAAFPELRSFLGWAGIVGLILAVVLFVIGLVLSSPPPMPTPSCNRTTLTTTLPGEYPAWGRYITVGGLTYMTDETGRSYCEPIKLGLQSYQGRLYQAWKEKPAPPEVMAAISASRRTGNAPGTFGFFLGWVSLALLVGLWLPATVLAATANKLFGDDD
jgi:hypothetical protein